MYNLEVLLVVLVSVSSISKQHVHYVLPDGSSPFNCPAQPCLTLDQYTEHTGTYFTTGATFLFLAGNHSLQATVKLTNISYVTLRGERNDTQSTIICRNTNINIHCYDVTNLTIEKLTFLVPFIRNDTLPVALNISASNNVKVSNCLFQGHDVDSGEAISLLSSSVEILSCTFNNIVSWILHTTIYAESANLRVNESKFMGNSRSGVIKAINTNLNITGSGFIGNECEEYGGAISARYSNLTISRSEFIGNRASYGGAIFAEKTCLTIYGSMFLDNQAVHVRQYVSGDEPYLGGAVLISNGNFTFSGSKFIGNKASHYGGAIAVFVGYFNFNANEILIKKSHFANNSAECGGAVYIKNVQEIVMHYDYTVTLQDISAVENTGSAVCVDFAAVTFSGTNLTSNTGRFGGGIYANISDIIMEDHNTLFNNSAIRGGGIYLADGWTLLLNGDILFSHNTADIDGGAIYVMYTNIIVNNRSHFMSNTAQNGGAMFIGIETTLIVNNHTNLITSHNHASLYGGAIYHEDKPTQYICSNPRKGGINKDSPDCFLMLKKYTYYGEAIITSHHDIADRDGSFLHGGLLDKCRLCVDVVYYANPECKNYNYSIIAYNFLITIFNITSNQNKANQIASMPYRLMFCDDPPHYYDKSVSVSRGQRFTISIQAAGVIDQKPVQVTALPGLSARVHFNQVIQTVSSIQCTNLTYNLYSSTQDYDELRLTTRGSCGDTGTVEVVIKVRLLPCPHPFVHEDEECACDQRLLEYPNVNCTTDEHNNSYITKKHGTDFWMSISYATNGSYKGLILYKTCPPQYCKTQTVAVSIDDLDSQCDDNRGGMLCGQCLANYSLMLGSSKCTHCSHKHLALLLPFAAAGIALVVFLSFLRLTVATAMINSVILYANILQVNRNFILPVNKRNILTIFIAWMNLDLGFETCFYDGMTAYAQTWLQFVFPLYVWILISLIILSSRYSITVSKLIGHNPIAVLATLILMSYTKLLKIIIEVYSSVDLDYPDNQRVTVWLRDANVPYLQSWHLLLTVVTTLVLVLFFLPYTLLLLLGYKLYRFSGRKHLRWFHRMRPLLESYYAPYNIHTRYWTGFLLLIRCVLYIIFSTDSLRSTDKSLLAINLTFTGLMALYIIMSICSSHQLYIKVHNNIMEISTYLNLIVLSAATIVGANPPALVYSLVGLVFVTMLGIIVYHFHVLYIAKSHVWQQFKVKVSTLKEKLIHSATRTAAEPPVGIGKSSHDPDKIITHSSIVLREPLL